MFSPKQLLALVAVLSTVNAACVRKSSTDGGATLPSSTESAPAAYSPSSSSSAAAVGAEAATTSSSASAAVVTYAPTTTSSSAPEFSTSSLAQEMASSSSSSSSSAVVTATSQTSAAAASSATGSSSASSSSSSSSDGTKYLVVFGDSYSSTGFYIEGDKPSASEPIGQPTLPGTTTSGGLNWVGLVTSEYNTSTVLTYDFAYYGADVSNTIINTGVTTDVIAQVADFEENLVPAPSYAEWTADNLLVAVWIGINDIGQCFWESAEYTTCPIDEVMTKYFSLMQNLYDDGVRNFVVNTVPPFYKAPAFNSYTTSDLSALVSNLDTYNNQLASQMAAFEATNTDVTLAHVFNTTSYFWQVLDDPTAYDLDSDITCANTDGTTCVWYDNYHPGQAVHELVAQGFVDALTGSFF